MRKMYFDLTKTAASYLIVLFLLSASAGCVKAFHTEWTVAPYPEIPKDSSIILWKNPGASDADFQLWKQHHNLPPPTKVNLCEFCNNDNLELYEGVGISAFMSGSGGGTPCTTCKPSGGGDDTAYYCYNFPVNLDTAFFRGQTVDTTGNNKEIVVLQNTPDPGTFHVPSQSAITGPIVNVGIFDTGVDPSITTSYTTPLTGACNPSSGSAASGWNFAGHNADTHDDYPGRHGTTVTKFIIDEIVHYQNQKVNIIPVKIFDASGRCSLSNILCGFAYASNSGIQIINASFGFYWHDLDNPPSLFSAFVKKYLTEKGILLIAAAGNRMVGEDNSTGMTYPDLRNLKKHPFYPAELAGKKGFQNVVAVTTVFPSPYNEVSPQQNFFANIVDIGVKGDEHYLVNLPAPKDEFGIIDPLGRTFGSRPMLISGSSYATPIVTGKIAAYYNSLVSGMGTPLQIDKPALLSGLRSRRLVTQVTSGGIPSQVRDGNYAVKMSP